jgi:hypothetical protein
MPSALASTIAARSASPRGVFRASTKSIKIAR